MSGIIDFLFAHWILSSLFVTLLSFYLVVEILYSNKDDKISSQLAVDFINHKHAIVIDIRQKEAFDASHIIDSINIPQNQIDENYKKIQKYSKKPVIVVCAAGKDAAKVVAKLKAQDFQQVLQLSGGMQEWITSGLPTTSNKKSQHS